MRRLALAACVFPLVAAAAKPNYVLKDGVVYGYEREISASDRIQGTNTQPLLMVRYLGKRDGKHQIYYKINTVVTLVAQCDEPCQFAKVYTYVNQENTAVETLRATPGSLVQAMFADAIAGHLEPHLYVRNGKKQAAWVDEKGQMRFFNPPAK